MTERKQEKYYTAKEIADMLGVTPATVRNWIRENRLEAIRPSPRAIRVSETSLETFLQQSSLQTAH
jgi:excisionase family DNA binding protein